MDETRLLNIRKEVQIILITRFFQKNLYDYDFEEFKEKIPSIYNVSEKFDANKYISMHLVVMDNACKVRCGIIRITDLIQFYQFIKPIKTKDESQKVLKINFQSYPFLYGDIVTNNFEFVYPLNYTFEDFKSYIKKLIRTAHAFEKVPNINRRNLELKSFNYVLNFNDIYQG